MDLTNLRDAMRSPDLALEPPASLEAAVRRSARGLRLRRRAGSAVLALATLSAGALVLPGLLAEDGPAQVAGGPPETYGVPDATSEVVLLDRVNDAAVVTYYQGADACISAVRVTRPRECNGPQRAGAAPRFPTVFNVVTVDRRRFLAGTVSVTGPVTLWLDLEEGEPVVVSAVSGRGFVVPVFHVELPPGAVPVRLRAVDAAGTTIATRDL